MALSGDEPPIVVIGELKLSFNLELLLQAVDRAGACDEVWLAAKMSVRGKGRESDARYRNLCRRLGFGMLAVTSTGDVEVIVKPPTTGPRRNPKKRSRLVAEHRRRVGDPVLGGSTRAPIMTAYRQQALACASELSRGPRRVRDLKPEFPDAPKIIYEPLPEDDPKQRRPDISKARKLLSWEPKVSLEEGLRRARPPIQAWLRDLRASVSAAGPFPIRARAGPAQRSRPAPSPHPIRRRRLGGSRS